MNPLILLDHRLWIAIFIAALLAAAGYEGYQLGSEHVQGEFDAYIAKQVSEELAAEKDAREKEHAMQSRNNTVSTNYANLKAATGTAVLALDADRMSLQSDLAATRRAAGDTEAGCRAYADTTDTILGQCIQRYEGVAAGAQGLSDQVVGLQEYVNTVVFPPQAK